MLITLISAIALDIFIKTVIAATVTAIALVLRVEFFFYLQNLIYNSCWESFFAYV